MVRFLRVASLFIVSLVAWAQAARAIQMKSGNSDTFYKLEGTVVNAQTGRPIAHALVLLSTTSTQAVLTGTEGEFSFANVAGGYATIAAAKPGFFVPGSRPQTAPTRRIDIGPQTGKLVLKLLPECVIAGEVMSDDGEPVEGATVEVLQEHISNGRRYLTQTQARRSVHTDEDGLFRIGGLEAGRYFVSVKAVDVRRFALGEQTNTNRAYPLVAYYPGVTDVDSAMPFDLAAGQHAHAPFTLSRSPAFTLSGRVTGMEDFKSVFPPAVVDATQNRIATVSGWDSQSGAFEFPPMPSGVYTLLVNARVDDEHMSWTRQSVTLNHNVSGFNFVLPHGVTIPVSVRTEFSLPGQCSGYYTVNTTTYECGKFPAMVTLTSFDVNYVRYQAQAETADPSTLALRSVMPGTYQVHITSMAQGYVYSAHYGTTNLLREELVVPAGGSIQPIEIVLRDGHASVKVHVQAEHIPAQARILMIPEFASFERPITLDVMANGDREYGGLAPGDYKVLAFESIDEIEYENPVALEKYSAKTARVTLTAQGTTNVTVELIREGE
jgi:hypothetical protein